MHLLPPYVIACAVVENCCSMPGRPKSDRSAKVLRENARKFNNALALSYNDVVEPFDEQGG